MTWEDLKDKPRFGDIAPDLLDFVRDAEWVIHNAPFDVAFIDHELSRCGHGGCNGVFARVVDTLTLAREQFPGKRNSLDALCDRFGVDRAGRALHGALLDARLLADVYLAMTRGQESLTIDIAQGPTLIVEGSTPFGAGRSRAPMIVVMPTADELQAHRAYLEALDRESKGRCMWLALESVAAA
jgi:DNA polymerase-3 subunit epsilon